MSAYALPVLCTLTFGNAVYRVWSFIYVHYLHRTTIQRFAHKDSYVLVTGSSGGLGLALCENLYDRGFNLIIHGRSLEKLHNIRAELNARSSFKRDVQYFVADGCSASWDFTSLKDLKINTLFLCAGGAPVAPLRLDSLTDAEVTANIRYNALFPLFLTKYILPTMRATQLPLLICAIGSEASSTAIPPYLSIYAGSKAFLHKWIKCLAADEKFAQDPSSDITVHYMSSGEFHSPANNTPVSYMCPTTKTMAKAVIGCVGCGTIDFLPYVGHALAGACLAFVGETIATMIVTVFVRRRYMAGELKKD